MVPCISIRRYDTAFSRLNIVFNVVVVEMLLQQYFSAEVQIRIFSHCFKGLRSMKF